MPHRPPPAVYPRVCGGTLPINQGHGDSQGLSPRVRGNRPLANEKVLSMRSIPACAGEPQSSSPVRPSDRVYPRVCGGTPWGSRPPSCEWGLSPRVRGNPDPSPGESVSPRSIPACAGEPPPILLHPITKSGSIPACAGEPEASALSVAVFSVYPRVCGGTPREVHAVPAAPGLSPRVRGNPAVR